MARGGGRPKVSSASAPSSSQASAKAWWGLKWWDLDSVVSALVMVWTAVVALGVGLYLYSEHLKRSKAEQAAKLKSEEEASPRSLDNRAAEQEALRRKKYNEKALLRLWQSEPWKREFVGEWSMIDGSRQGFYEWVLFMGKSEVSARKAATIPLGNTIMCQRIDDKSLDENFMRVDMTGVVTDGVWVNVGGPASEVVSDKMVNLEKISWDEDMRALIRTRECPAAGYEWKQTRTIERGMMRLSVVTTRKDGTSAAFTMALHKKVVS